MSTMFWVAGDGDRAIVYSQRALALGATLGQVGFRARAHLQLGLVYYDTGHYTRAVESLERNVTTLRGELLSERFGADGSVAASSRAWLGLCHAELGAFTEGLALAKDGLRLTETVNNPFSQVEACFGIGMESLRQGDRPRAIPVLEQAMGLCQDWPIPLFLPIIAAALGLAYALEARVTAGLALAEQGMERAVARGIPRFLAPSIGQQERSRGELSTAVDFYRAMDMTFWLPQAEATLALVGG
jgi:tetratricopeptide (TPR) repeat protein